MNSLIPLLIKYKYLILFPAAAAEGPFVSLVVGFLIFMGYLQFLPSYGILILGDLIPDSLYYTLGRYGNKKNLVEKYFGRFAFISKNYALIDALWKNHPRKTMFFAKLAYGLSIPFLISAGLSNVPFKKFITYTIPATLFQYGVIMTVGYLLGHSYTLAEKYVQNAYVLVAVLFIIVLAGYVLFSRYATEQVKKIEQEEEEETSVKNNN